MPIIAVAQPLKDKLGDEAVQGLIDLLNQALAEQQNGTLKFVEEKFERRLSEEIGVVNANVSREVGGLLAKISQVEASLSARITQGDADLLAKIHETKAEIIKWMFIFWIGQVGVILGILFAFFK